MSSTIKMNCKMHQILQKKYVFTIDSSVSSTVLCYLTLKVLITTIVVEQRCA